MKKVIILAGLLLFMSFTAFADQRGVFMPICDGGCIVRRYNQKHYNVPYDPCPINEDDFLSLMEIYFMKENK